MQSVLILGRQPALGLAELESLYGAEAVQPIGNEAAILDVDPSTVDFNRLGGSIKLARLLTTLDTTEWREIEKYLIKTSPEQAGTVPEGKLVIGLSVYGLKVTPAAIGATGLTLKKAIRKTNPGRSVRLVPNKQPELNTAQVLYNRLVSENGWELLLVRNGNKTVLAQTVQVQDIDSYTARDRERPKRDARVGMLPPKLAQIIINLAVDRGAHIPTALDDLSETTAEERVRRVQQTPTVLDPFCGTGVILQEAMLMGYYAYGTDLDKRMVEYTTKNIEWLRKNFELGDFFANFEQGDATSYVWTQKFTHVACETYLGWPLTSLPAPEILHQTISECNTIIRKFLKNIGAQVQPGTRLCLAVPAWQVRSGQFKHLPLLDSPIDQLSELGYNRISFEHVRTEDLLYYRSDQIVARELLVLTRK